jgi:NAD(P)-dependent dehydrogenase (short-subunit alcohol dehydrogenase family)
VLLEGKTAIVSGAGPGLGRSICWKLAAQGANVVAADLDAAALDAAVAVAGDAAAGGARAVGQETDITDRGRCDALVARAVEEFGGLDIVVNDAYHGGDFSPFEAADLGDWRATADVNIFGTLNVIQAALDPLKASGSGRIVNICTHGVDLIQPTFAAYTSSKAAIAHLTQLLAAELGGYGIRVNAVFPGPIWGGALQGYLDQQAAERGVAPQVLYDEFASKSALKALNQPDDIAYSVVFLASDMARPITGQALYANSGESFH